MAQQPEFSAKQVLCNILCRFFQIYLFILFFFVLIGSACVTNKCFWQTGAVYGSGGATKMAKKASNQKKYVFLSDRTVESLPAPTKLSDVFNWRSIWNVWIDPISLVLVGVVTRTLQVLLSAGSVIEQCAFERALSFKIECDFQLERLLVYWKHCIVKFAWLRVCLNRNFKKY